MNIITWFYWPRFYLNQSESNLIKDFFAELIHLINFSSVSFWYWIIRWVETAISTMKQLDLFKHFFFITIFSQILTADVIFLGLLPSAYSLI